MKKILDVTILAGFLAVDFFFFHDLFKSGEVITLPMYLTGLLSLPVMFAAVQSIIKN